jgi:uncharacterized membrane protein YiaA
MENNPDKDGGGGGSRPATALRNTGLRSIFKGRSRERERSPMPFPKRWIAAIALVATAILGLYGASQSGHGGGYTMGLVLFALSVGFLFTLVKKHFDGSGDEQLFTVFPRQPRNLWLLLVLLGVIGVACLGLAAASEGVVYWVGLALFIVCCVMGFRVIKLAFDRQ